MTRKLYNGLITIGQWLQSPLLLLMRLYWGYAFFTSGLGKLMNISSIAAYFHSLNIPWPTLNAYMAGTTECLGGLLLILGLVSRLISIPLAVVMLVAFATADVDAIKGFWADPYNLVSHTPFTYLMCVLIIFAFGPGRFSLDHWLGIDKGTKRT